MARLFIFSSASVMRLEGEDSISIRRLFSSSFSLCSSFSFFCSLSLFIFETAMACLKLLWRSLCCTFRSSNVRFNCRTFWTCANCCPFWRLVARSTVHIFLSSPNFSCLIFFSDIYVSRRLVSSMSRLCSVFCNVVFSRRQPSKWESSSLNFSFNVAVDFASACWVLSFPFSTSICSRTISFFWSIICLPKLTLFWFDSSIRILLCSFAAPICFCSSSTLDFKLPFSKPSLVLSTRDLVCASESFSSSLLLAVNSRSKPLFVVLSSPILSVINFIRVSFSASANSCWVFLATPSCKHLVK